MALATAVASEMRDRLPTLKWTAIGVDGCRAHVGVAGDRTAIVLCMGTWWTWYPEGWPYHTGRPRRAYGQLTYQEARAHARLWLTRAGEPL